MEDKNVFIKPTEEDKMVSRKPASSSVGLDLLFTAMAKAQAEIGVAGLNNKNPFFKSKYADLTELVRVSRPALTKHGLSIIQRMKVNEEGNNLLVTMLCHSSGQYIESEVKISPQKSDIQAFGSYVTYLKRYCYSALIGVCTSEDDDGYIAMPQKETSTLPTVDENKNVFIKPREETTRVGPVYVSSDQLDQLNDELIDYPELAMEIMEKMGIKSLAKVPKEKFLASIKRIREIKLLKPSALQST